MVETQRSSSGIALDTIEQVQPKPRAKKKQIVILGQEGLSKEEIAKLKHNEKMRRYNARKRKAKQEAEAKEARDTLVREVAEGKYDTKELYIPKANIPLSKQEMRLLDNKAMVELSANTRNNILQVLEMKVSQLYEDPEELKKVNLATLATAFGIMFDKNQLMHGLATENIAIQAKIDINMTSDMALAELNKMREEYAERNG